MNISQFYGNETEEIKVEPKTQTSISYRDKEAYNVVPANAEITKREVNINVREIENGFLKSVCTNIWYNLRSEENEVSEHYCYNEECYYSAKKPIDIELRYSMD